MEIAHCLDKSISAGLHRKVTGITLLSVWREDGRDPNVCHLTCGSICCRTMAHVVGVSSGGRGVVRALREAPTCVRRAFRPFGEESGIGMGVGIRLVRGEWVHRVRHPCWELCCRDVSRIRRAFAGSSPRGVTTVLADVPSSCGAAEGRRIETHGPVEEVCRPVGTGPGRRWSRPSVSKRVAQHTRSRTIFRG